MQCYYLIEWRKGSNFIFTLTIFLPKYFIDIAFYVYGACDDKEVVAQTVDKSEYIAIDINGLAERDDLTLGASGDSARNLGAGRVGASAGQDEAVVARQGGVEPVDGLLETCYAR